MGLQIPLVNGRMRGNPAFHSLAGLAISYFAQSSMPILVADSYIAQKSSGSAFAILACCSYRTWLVAVAWTSYRAIDLG